MRKEELRTPCYIVQKEKLEENLRNFQKDSGRKPGARFCSPKKRSLCISCTRSSANIWMAQRPAASMRRNLERRRLGKENHIFSPAYKEGEFDEILSLCGHIVLNSPSQIRKYKERIRQAGKSPGIRVNPQCSTQKEHAIYDPCAPGSRLGTVREQLSGELMDGIEGIHFHTLCEQNSDALEVTLKAVEEKFGRWLPKMKMDKFRRRTSHNENRL